MPPEERPLWLKLAWMAGIWTALTQIRGPKEPLPMIESEHDNLTPDKGRACPARTKEIRDTLLTGGEFKPNGLR